MRCLADFILDSDLCLKEGTGSLTLAAPDNDFTLTLSNVKSGSENIDAVLSAQLIFEASSFENIREIACDKLAKALNALTYATNSKFVQVLLKRVIDWTPGIIERQAIIYVETPELEKAEPALDNVYLGTARRLLVMQSGEKQQEALRWYRLGIQADNLEEQFSYFWFALEIAAEYSKGTEKVPSKCPKCQQPLFCESCGEHPMHRKYAGEAIRQIISRIQQINADEVFKTLQVIRHTLMHGGRINSVLDQLPCTDEQAVNKLAFVTWHAIGFMFTGADPEPSKPMELGYRDSLVRRTLVAGATITTGMQGDPNNPQLANFPSIQFRVTHAANDRMDDM